MKIKLLESNYLKALDIDLKLNNNSKENVNRVVKSISSNIKRNSENLNLRVDGSVRSKEEDLYIPDDAKIERFDIKDWKDKKNISNKIRLDQNETFYFLMSEADQLLDTAIDGIPLINSENSIPFSLTLVDYVLIVKREELLKTKAKKEERITVEKSSVELQKVKRKEQALNLFKIYYKWLINKKDEYYRAVKRFEIDNDERDLPTEYLPLKNLPSISAADLTKDMYFFMDPNPTEDIDFYRLTADFSSIPFDEGSDEFKTFENIIILESSSRENPRTKERTSGRIGKNETYYLFDPSKMKEKEVKKDDFEIEQFTPEISLKTLIKKDSTFPDNLFPTYGDKRIASEVDGMIVYWNNLKKIIDELKFKNFNIENELEQFEKAVKKGTRVSRSMTFIDKSGYMVDLSKYFDKLASIPPQVPKLVKEKYESVFKHLTKETEKLVQLIKNLADEGNFEEISTITSILKNNGPKNFNSKFEVLVGNENAWSRNYSGYKKPSIVIEEMEEAKIEFDDLKNNIL